MKKTALKLDCSANQHRGLFRISLMACLFMFLAAMAEAASGEGLEWAPLPPLPPAVGQTQQIGLAGPFVGVHGDALLLAGGANFPEGLPWEGGAKVWWDDVFVLLKDAENREGWVTHESFRLPRPLAYGISVDTDEGVLCVGGCDAERCYADVFLLKWDAKTQRVETEPFAPLPRPLAFMAGARVGDVVYVAGGQETTKDAAATKNFWALDLSKTGVGGGWEELPPWPGPARILPVAAGQSDGTTNCFYLFSGRKIAPGKKPELLSDAYRYNPKDEEWKRLSDIAPEGGEARCVMAAPGMASGANHILVFGGADGKLFLELDQLERDIKTAAETPAEQELVRKKLAILNNHPGFSKDVLAYHTITDTWTLAAQFPSGSHVTTTAANWDGGFVIPTGEISPGIRTPKVWKASPPPVKAFGMLNYTVVGVYLGALVCMGFYFSRREKSTDDFFRAGGRVPWWAAGLSIFGTQLSAITFMAIPAKTFATDWRYFMLNMSIIMVAPFIILIYLPFYRRLNVTTAYEYLERRFNLLTRLIGSLLYMLFQFGRIGIVLFLPSVALSVVTGVNVELCILLMGVLSILYTVLGGIEAVVWTDVIQVFVLLGGALLCLILIPFQIDGGYAGILELAHGADKLRAFDFRFDFTAPTFYVMLLGGISGSLISYGSDQTVIQRYLTTKDEKSAARGIWTNAWLSIPATFIFFSIGTALYAFYASHPARLSPTLDNSSAIFPWYIVTELPAGVAGLLIAGIFAAAMSSLDSAMNSVSAAVTTDFYRRFRPEAEEHKCLLLARWITVIVGLIGIGSALWMARSDIKSMWDQLNKVIGLFGGGLGGLFLLGIFTRRAHGTGAVVGLLFSCLTQYLISEHTEISVLLLPFTGLASCFIAGYLASMILPSTEKSVEGFTLGTLKGNEEN